jgi:hypothetical protein
MQMSGECSCTIASYSLLVLLCLFPFVPQDAHRQRVFPLIVRPHCLALPALHHEPTDEENHINIDQRSYE